MKKITILALHLNFGGIEKYISYLCKMFGNDYELEIISTYKYRENPAFEFSDNINIKYLTDDYPDRISIKSILKQRKYLGIIKEIIRRIRLKVLAFYMNKEAIKKLNADYVITTRTYHNYFVNRYLKNSKIIKIATEHNYHNNNRKYIQKVVDSTTNFDYFIHCTNELYSFYAPLIKGPKNIKIFNPVYVDNNLKTNLKNLEIISVGRLSEEKGYLDLIDVMKEINKINPKIKLTICGDGYERTAIESKIKTYGLEHNIKMLGFVGGKTLENAYTKAAIYIMPSKLEAFGLVLLEAMHYGLPCIAFDSASGARGLLKNDIGILIKDRNIKAMANKIIELLNNKEELNKYSNKSLECVKNYSLNKIYKEWQKILK